MIGLLGKKVAMTQLFDEEGRQIAVSVLKVGPCVVTDIRKQEKHGYSAVQLAFDSAREKTFSKPQLGKFKKLGIEPRRFVREIRTTETAGLEIGTELYVDNFEVGDFVDVHGTSIGRGFQGVVKRLHYKGGEGAHGTKMGREPGSIGAKAGGRGCRKKVRKGKGLPGHMGNEHVTTQNLKVMKIDRENNLLLVEGSVPGFDGRYLVIETALKRGKPHKWKVANAAGKETPKDKKESSEVSSPEVPAVESKPEGSEKQS